VNEAKGSAADIADAERSEGGQPPGPETDVAKYVALMPTRASFVPGRIGANL